MKVIKSGISTERTAITQIQNMQGRVKTDINVRTETVRECNHAL